jgi:hypothetical protein
MDSKAECQHLTALLNIIAHRTRLNNEDFHTEWKENHASPVDLRASMEEHEESLKFLAHHVSNHLGPAEPSEGVEATKVFGPQEMAGDVTEEADGPVATT